MNSNPCFRGIPKLDAAPPERKVDIPIFISSFALEEPIKIRIKLLIIFFLICTIFSPFI